MSSKHCPKCIHYRQPLQLASILKAQIVATHEDTIKALDEISGREDAHRMQESAIAALPPEAAPPTWPHRPRTVPYCGLYESRDWFYVCARKNLDQNCPDYVEHGGDAEAHCARCANRMQPSGDESDREVLYQIAERVAYALHPHPGLNAEYQRIEKAAAAMKAYEVREAYRSHGVLPREPRYLSWCKALARDGVYAVPESRNTGHDCAAYIPIRSA